MKASDGARRIGGILATLSKAATGQGQAGDRPHDMAWLHGLHMIVEIMVGTWATAVVIKSS